VTFENEHYGYLWEHDGRSVVMMTIEERRRVRAEEAIELRYILCEWDDEQESPRVLEPVLVSRRAQSVGQIAQGVQWYDGLFIFFHISTSIVHDPYQHDRPSHGLRERAAVHICHRLVFL